MHKPQRRVRSEAAAGDRPTTPTLSAQPPAARSAPQRGTAVHGLRWDSGLGQLLIHITDKPLPPVTAFYVSLMATVSLLTRVRTHRFVPLIASANCCLSMQRRSLRFNPGCGVNHSCSPRSFNTDLGILMHGLQPKVLLFLL